MFLTVVVHGIVPCVARLYCITTMGYEPRAKMLEQDQLVQPADPGFTVQVSDLPAGRQAQQKPDIYPGARQQLH